MAQTDSINASSQISQFESIICGGVAGLVSRFVIAPLDVVKIRLQLDPNTVKKPGAAMIQTISKLARKEGLRALWKGNIPAEAMYICYGAIQFTTYKQLNLVCKQIFGISDSSNAFISGAAAGVVSTCCTYPMDLLRTRFAAQKTNRAYTSIAHALSSIYKQEGVRGYFRGLSPTILSIVPYMGLFFASYEQVRTLLDKAKIRYVAPDATAGFLAGVFAKMTVFPLDVVRKRFQVQGPGRQSFSTLPVYSTNLFVCIQQIVKLEGIRGLYKGFGISIMKNAPFTAVTMWTFERSLRVLRTIKGENLDH